MSLVRVKVPDDDDDEGLERKESAEACEKLKNSLFARSFFSWLAARVGLFQVFFVGLCRFRTYGHLVRKRATARTHRHVEKGLG